MFARVKLPEAKLPIHVRPDNVRQYSGGWLPGGITNVAKRWPDGAMVSNSARDSMRLA
jgi:hypothetical protein